MKKPVLTRTNLLLEIDEVRRLRTSLRTRSKSEAVQRAIDERLAINVGIEALQELQALGGLEDVFGRASSRIR